MKSVPTYTATIYVGLREGYDGKFTLRAQALAAIEHYVDTEGLGVSVTDTQFVYTGGDEPGLIVGLINYPRFPSTQEDIRGKALALARRLKEYCKQQRVSIVFPDETVVLEAE